MQYRDDTKEWPIEAITFNHRQMAFYKAYEENPNAPAVVGTLDRGLRSVRMLSSHCPDYLVRDLVRLHNLSHGGSGLHMFDLIDSALELEQAWQSAQLLGSLLPIRLRTRSFTRSSCLQILTSSRPTRASNLPNLLHTASRILAS